MIKRLTMLLMTLAYLGAAAWLGLDHHHEANPSHSDQCAACAWQINATSDTPVITTAILFRPIETPVALPTTVSVPAQFVPTSASRAPPETSA
jgi:hypothetical protein